MSNDILRSIQFWAAYYKPNDLTIIQKNCYWNRGRPLVQRGGRTREHSNSRRIWSQSLVYYQRRQAFCIVTTRDFQCIIFYSLAEFNEATCRCRSITNVIGRAQDAQISWARHWFIRSEGVCCCSSQVDRCNWVWNLIFKKWKLQIL